MKAVVVKEFGDIDKLIYTDIENPQAGEGEVLIKIKAAGVNPADKAVSEGLMKRIETIFPFVPGWDMAGVVEETGYGVSRFSAGDEVYSYARLPVIHHGTYAEYIVLPESIVSLKPHNITFEEAAAVPLTALTAYQSLFEAGRIQHGRTILIIGASGGVGSFAVQFAKIAGAEVYAIAGSNRAGYLRQIGADHIVDYTQGNLSSLVKEVLPNGADYVYDCGVRNITPLAYSWVKTNGTLVSILAREDKTLSEKYKINFKYIFVEPDAAQLDVIRNWIEEGELKVHIFGVFDLKDVAEAHKQIETHHTQGKIVLKIP